jgi:D-alanyl-D-alanine carboxypeptidase/D-alanyl-D-alanine-endopeptidase (penicillin-binding protein 4)
MRMVPLFILLGVLTHSNDGMALKVRHRQPTAFETPAKLKKEIEDILPPSKKLDVGICAVSLDRGDVVYERNADEKLIPASVNKIFTAYVALKKLKPSATFKTWVFMKGTLHEGTLQGDLYLKGGGDPSFVSERLWMMVNDLVRSGIKTVNGNLFADSSYYDEEKTPQSRPKYLKDQAYNAPVGALSFNFNTTTIYVKPGESPGATPVVYTDPENSYIDVVNQAKTVKAGAKNTVTVSRTDFVKGDIGDTILLRGNIPMDNREMRFYRNIVNPALYTAHMFKLFMEQRGIKVSGVVKEGDVPGGAKQIVEFESLPLWHVIWGMNKFSNNFVADQIMKKVGADAWGPPGTLEKGLTALGDALEDIGIPRKSYEIQDGSGLTRNTRVTPRQIVTLLTAAYKDFAMAPEFEASLGIGGEDGTLRNRFPSMAGRPLVRAKTGTLDGVTALAGFIQTESGERLAFSIMLNDLANKFGRMAGWADQVATALTKFTRE